MPHKELFKQSLIYSGPLIWTNPLDNLRQLETIKSFHKNCIKLMKRVQSTAYQSKGVPTYMRKCTCMIFSYFIWFLEEKMQLMY